MRYITHSVVSQCLRASTQIYWEIENLTVCHAQTPQAMNNEICTVDFVMRNIHTIFHHNPLEVYISQ